MTGYQRAKIVALWIRSGKLIPLDEFAATIDVKTIIDPNPKNIKNQPINAVANIFPGATVVGTK